MWQYHLSGCTWLALPIVTSTTNTQEMCSCVELLVHTCMASKKSLAGSESEGTFNTVGSLPLLDDVAVLSSLLIASDSPHAIAFDSVNVSLATYVGTACALRYAHVVCSRLNDMYS